MNTDRLKRLCELSPFSTGPYATTDLHAGGVFFCVLYRRELEFHLNGHVDLTYRVLDNWRPFDDEAESLATQSCRGTLVESSRDYIEISFPGGLSFTGSECDNLDGHLAFHVFGKIKYDAGMERLMGRDISDLPKDFTESLVFTSS